MSDEGDYEYHRNKRSDKTYVSKSLAFALQKDRRLRIASKVFDATEGSSFAWEHDELVIRVTAGGRQEIVAKFFEDNRGVLTLIIQRFNTDTGAPHRVSFSFSGAEIPRLLEFIENIRAIHFPSAAKVNITDAELKKLLLTPTQARSLVLQNQELVLELARSEITKSDLIAIGYRKAQLDVFEKLLTDEDYFEQLRRQEGTTAEGVWQAFFERNKWVFGYGLTYLAMANLDGKNLEQTVKGFDFTSPGKRADALMKTKGAIEALCFVEIKKHTTFLLKDAPYRSGCWAPSDEVAGGVAQVQGTLELAIRGLTEKVETSSADGEPTGEQLFTFQPRSFLIVGSLTEFQTENGVNIQKYRSFELYRRGTLQPQILTFDELLHRARFIVEHSQ